MSTEAITHQPPTTNGTPHQTSSSQPQQKHIWVITGPAGCGKTSVAEYLHQQLQIPYLEGDTFHTPENVQKMSQGQPLTDADRWDWLILCREQCLSTLHSPTPAPTASTTSTTTSTTSTTTPSSRRPSQAPPSGVILTCSALKRKYRDVLRVAAYHNPSVSIHFVFLSASEAVLMDRVRARQNHYMKDYMVHSQFQSLEAPQGDELDEGGVVRGEGGEGRRGDVLSVDAGGQAEEVRRWALGAVKGVL
ncbi:hypothetical protein LTR56_002019 [Elasticomyces elasticus]|nr:hypothetical protein LTR22_022260 [Elasticomyces elasticus]KAK3658162.1 hypothetical protein LTR56_002019 [Elasticomyces elasticus]KAK4907278.1 hypothetical protein LTR49_023691 [Elasticomyces elasticus]KAK5764047.1 hypothetical protein LTS12_005741 [Elasticomyces elasticus]